MATSDPGTIRCPAGTHRRAVIGDVETVAQKILYVNDVSALSRITFQMGVSALPHRRITVYELLGTGVAPLVHKELTSVASTDG